MDAQTPPLPPQPDERSTTNDLGWREFKIRFRSRIMAGLILAIPLWLTVWLVRFVFGLLRDMSLWVVEGFLLSPAGKPWLERWNVTATQLKEGGLEALPTSINWLIAILAVGVTLMILYFLGGITANVVGRRFVRIVEGLVNRLPLVKTVYHASKQVLETFSGDSRSSFKQVVTIPFPAPNCRTIGFVTNKTKDVRTGEEVYAVFVATAPNPTTGFVYLIRSADVVELDWSVEEAIKVVMSGGMLAPPQVPLTPTSAAWLEQQAQDADRTRT